MFGHRVFMRLGKPGSNINLRTANELRVPYMRRIQFSGVGLNLKICLRVYAAVW